MPPVHMDFWSQLMERARARFAPGNDFGVVAYGKGRQARRGLDTGKETLVVYVERKESAPRQKVGAFEFGTDASTTVVHPDVRGVGGRRRRTDGKSPIYSGLHPGSALRVGDAAGAVACLLTHDGDGPTHLVTAGHVFPEGAEDTEVRAASDPSSDVAVIGTLTRNLLDVPCAHTGYPFDVALVALTDDGQQMAWDTLDSGLELRLTEIVDADFMHGEPVQAYLPTRADYSDTFYANSEPFEVAVETEDGLRAYVLRDIVRVPGLQPDLGDSGTVVMTVEEDRRAVGFCVGRIGDFALVEPLTRATLAFEEHLGESLALWPSQG